MKDHYRRNLPHIQPIGGTFFVTFNLFGSIPKEVLEIWQEEYAAAKSKILQFSKEKQNDFERLGKIDFLKRDRFYDSYTEGNHYLKNDTLAKIVADSLHFWDNKKIELYAYCIMSNHVHISFRLFGEFETEKPMYLEQIMHSIKRFSAKECNELLGLEGIFWQHESYDRLVRNESELKNILFYILNNPVKAGLCKEIREWKWSYIKEIYNDIM